jgi:hypothetical protein
MKKKKRKARSSVERKPDSPAVKLRKDLARVKKLEAIIETVQSSSYGNVSITALRSMESLCDTPEKMQRFALFLAENTFAAKAINLKQVEKELIERALKAMHAKLNGEKGESIPVIHSACYRYQNEIQRLINGYSVRIIKCDELFLIEKAIECFQTPHNTKCGYLVARHYVEQWSSHNSIGIIPESIPALRDVIGFWKAELQTVNAVNTKE